MASTSRDGALSAGESIPPRPPNAWILYRSTKLKDLPPLGPGSPRRSQGEISSVISKLWKNETVEVRAHFDQLSEEAKIAHRIRYPGYRYQPKSKAVKEREREMKKQQRKESKNRTTRTRRRNDHEEQQSIVHPMSAGSSSGSPYYIPPRSFPPRSTKHSLLQFVPTPPDFLSFTSETSSETSSTGNSPRVSPIQTNNALPPLLPALFTPEVPVPCALHSEIISALPIVHPEPQPLSLDAEPYMFEFNDLLEFTPGNVDFGFLNNYSSSDAYRGSDDLSNSFDQAQGDIEVSIGTYPFQLDNQYYDYHQSDAHTVNDAFNVENNTFSNDHYQGMFDYAPIHRQYTLPQSF